MTPKNNKRTLWRGCGGPLAAALVLALGLNAQATVLDSFSGAKTGWTDSLTGGTISQSGGYFTISTAAANGSTTSSEKTSTSFAIATGNTLELRVDLGAVTPGNGNASPTAILGWVPAGGTLAANGYSLSVNAANAVLKKGATVLNSINFTTAYGTNIQNTNLTLAIRLTPAGGSTVTVDARVYLQTGGTYQQNFTCIYEYVATDASGSIGSQGYATLGASNAGSPTGVSASFANLQYFVLANSVLDTFTTGNLASSGWTTFAKASAVPGITSGVTETAGTGGNPGSVEVVAGLASSGGFAGAYYAGQTFKVTDGVRLEFSVDFDNLGNDELNGGGGSYSVLGYLPIPNLSYVYELVAYHIAHDIHNSSYLVVGKNYNAWWATGPDGLPVTNCRYTLAMTGEGTSERIEARLENLALDINDPNRIAFQNVFVDTGSDVSGQGVPSPYLGFNGSFIMFAFASGPCYEADVVFRNPQVSQTVGGATPPTILNVAPADSSAFVASTSAVSFEVRDQVGIPATGISLTLNGALFNSTSPGVTVTGNSKDWVFTLANRLTAGVGYVATINATNSQQLTATDTVAFDTFGNNVYVVEAEEFNFSLDGVNGGAFIDNPALLTDDYLNNPGVTAPNAYNGQAGLPGTDYHTSTDPNDFALWWATQDANHVSRWNDPAQTTYSSDTPRAKYTAAGGSANGYYEVDSSDIHDGDWANYTHTYPAGTYAVYLRQEQYFLLQSLVTLERVTSDRTQPGQTTSILGSFLGTPHGSGPHANVPLTDGAGNPVVVRETGGVDTLRLNDRVTGNGSTSTGFITENYFVLAPVADPGVLRPIVAVVSPLANQVVAGTSPATYAIIANRDTTVNTGSIALTINGVSVPITTTPSPSGVEVDWSITAVPAAASLTNTITYTDSAGVPQSFSWSYSYPYLSPANSLPVGSLGAKGFQARTAWSANGGVTLDNSLARALSQLANPPTIPVDGVCTSMVSELNWNLSGTPNNIPGLCAPGSQINVAVEALAYLHLTAGLHRFYVSTDDRAGFYSGTTPWDPSGTTLFEAPGNTATTTFDFMVGAEGLYPFRGIWEQTGGGALLQLAAVDPSGVNPNAVVGDPSEPAGAVDAYIPVVCLSTTSLTGTFTADATAVATTLNLTTTPVTGDCGTVVNQMISGGTGTFTIPVSGSEKFFRVSAPRPCTITGIKKSGSNVVVSYQLN